MSELPATRHSLLLRLADAGDDSAWREFLEVYEKAVLRFAVSRGLPQADAEDVTQRVLVAVVGKVRTWQPEATRGSFGAWLFRVTRNLAARSWNNRIGQPVQFGDRLSNNLASLEDIPDASESDATLFQLEYRRALFHWAADRVRDQVQTVTWQAFWMTAVEQKAARIVAENLCISVAAVYTAKCRLLARIRIEIEEFESEFSESN